MFTLALAIGILMIRDVDLLETLFGNITTVTIMDTAVAVTASVIAVLLTRMIYEKLVLSMISEELATSKGINVSRVNLLYLVLVSLVVAVSIKIVGSLLAGFLVVVPAAAAKNISANLFKYAVLSAFFGIVSTCSGILVSSYFNLPTGPLVVISGFIVFLATAFVKWRKK
jgi:ABC-type Mn2+/Zn2+ transport system permease subunit